MDKIYRNEERKRKVCSVTHPEAVHWGWVADEGVGESQQTFQTKQHDRE